MSNQTPYDQIPRSARIRDVTLRDGLQSISTVLPTESKIQLHGLLVDAGVKHFQVTSFVNPIRVPQLADAESTWAVLSGRPQRNSVLVANIKGFDRAVKAGAIEIEAVASISNTFNLRNAKRTLRESLDEVFLMAAQSRNAGCSVTIALANCYHCFFEGHIQPERVLDVIGECREQGIREILLCDTTGCATPDQVYKLASNASAMFPDVSFGAHLHDTRGRALANAVAALMANVTWFDAAIAGTGGCPFTPGVGGNLSLEAVVDAFSEMGVETGIDPARMVQVGRLARERRLLPQLESMDASCGEV
jgi:hydroxymethylglutaryl-CoA lyase